jgi:predicted cupin superfamily sugar epimerase
MRVTGKVGTRGNVRADRKTRKLKEDGTRYYFLEKTTLAEWHRMQAQ